jgi:hypothetical protein
MVEEEPEDIMVPVGFTTIHEALHVVILKGVDLLLCHTREDAWTTTRHLLVGGTGLMTGGRWNAKMLLTYQRCAEWQLILLLHKIWGFRGGKNFLPFWVMTPYALIEGYWMYQIKQQCSPVPLKLLPTMRVATLWSRSHNLHDCILNYGCTSDITCTYGPYYHHLVNLHIRPK